MEHLGMTFWKDRNVFVTGATGLLGSWLTEALLSQGANVVCLVRDWVPGSKLVESGLIQQTNVVRGEVEDYQMLLRALNEYEIDTVFHLGAQTIVGTSVRSALSTFESNIRGTWNLLEACKNCPTLVQRVVVASSDKAYGPQEKLPYTENTPLEGRYPYDVSKSCSDLIASCYFHTYQVPIAITRCGNLFGGGDLNFNRLIPGTIRSVLQGQAPIIRSDGKYIRDYFYVGDAANAYLSLAEHLPQEPFVGQAFNFSTGVPVTVLELVQTILGVMDQTHLVPQVLNGASNEILEQTLDCTKARELLGWQSEYTLENALRETVEWYRRWHERSGGLAKGLSRSA